MFSIKQSRATFAECILKNARLFFIYNRKTKVLMYFTSKSTRLTIDVKKKLRVHYVCTFTEALAILVHLLLHNAMYCEICINYKLLGVEITFNLETFIV